MTNYVQLIMDAESLGIADGSVVLDVSVLAYDVVADEKKTLAELLPKCRRFKLSIQDQVQNYKRTIDPDTVSWWKQQDVVVQRAVMPSAGDLTLPEFYEQFMDWVDEVKFSRRNGFCWIRGTADIAWVDSIWRDLKVKQNDRPLMWYKIRDIRTAVDISGISGRLNGYPDNFDALIKAEWPDFQKHNSVHDVVAEVKALRMSGVWPS